MRHEFLMTTPKGRVVLTVHRSLADLFQLYARVEDPQPTARVFDPAAGLVSDGFWVKGVDEASGRLVHVQAVGVIDIGRRSLLDHLEDNAHLYQPLDMAVDPELSRFDALAGAKISGFTCYHGDLWVLGGRAGYQGTRLAEKATRLAVHLAYEFYAIDHIWALVAEKKIRTGYPRRSGYQNDMSGGATWIGANGAACLEEWLVWNDRDDLSRLKLGERDVDVLRGLAQYSQDLAPVG